MITLIQPGNMTGSNVRAFFSTKAPNNDTKEVLNTDGIASCVYLPVQKHTSMVKILENDFNPEVADAILTGRKGVLIGVQVADCVPILLYDKEKLAVGAVHAGWRGTASGILKNTIKIMQEKFKSSAEDILIAIGPSIRECCYNVGSEVKDAVCEATGEGSYYHETDGKLFIDLSSANRIQALSMGVLDGNMWQSGECTFCNPERFHSYRYAKDSAGRQGGFIGML
ncbi:MAG: peptidoglycan editing factor PgeF [Nitrospirae bacterium]|nr:peptidoglycan editing factor PgeF [Nitrospirota bacterium]